MKVETFIRQYVAKNPNPDQKYCPVVYQYWRGHNSNGDYTKIHNSYTGELKVESPNIRWWKNHLTPRSYGYEGTYLKEVRKGLLEIALVKIEESNRGKDGIPKIWRYQTYFYHYNRAFARIFLDKETLKAYDVDGNEVRPEAQGKYYNHDVAKHIRTLGNYGRLLPENAQEIWQNFTGVTNVRVRWGAGDMTYPWHWESWYTHAAQRPISKLSENISSVEEKLDERNYPSATITFELLDEYGVFRCYKDGKEKARVFIDKKGKPTLRVRKVYEWETSSNDFYNEYYLYSGDNLETFGTENIGELECLRYIIPILDTSKAFNYTLRDIISILRHPIIEKLSKAGYKDIAKDLMYNDEVQANIRRYYGMNKVNEKSSIYKCLGLNKDMLKFIEKSIDRKKTNGWVSDIRWSDYATIIPAMKRILGEDISSLSKDKFELYWNGCNEIGNNQIKYYIDPDTTYRWRNDYELDDNDKRILDKLFKYEAKESGVIRAYKDTVSQFRNLRNKPNIDLMDFRNKEDILQTHDNITALYNAQREEDNRLYQMRDEERRKELQKKAEKLNEKRIELYECKGNDFSIVVPKDVVELTAEGSALHHCVGGYLQRYAMGDTNIVFLRKNNDIETPFYTIEVSNSGNIVQIHGKYNCWLGNNPEAIAFVNKWISDRGFRCEKRILLDTASGYGSSGKLVDESYLVA